MGWTSLHRDKGISDKEFFENNVLTKEKYELVASNSSAGYSGEFYAAIRDKMSGEVFSVVMLKTWYPKEYYNFCYKIISESSGPNGCRASQQVLDALTPTTSKYAVEWREAVKARLDRQKKLNKIKPGTHIRLDSPVSLTSGDKMDVFTIMKGRNLVRSIRGQMVRLNWKEYSFTVV